MNPPTAVRQVAVNAKSPADPQARVDAQSLLVSSTGQALSVAAVVVSYNVRDLLLDCVASLETLRDLGEVVEIVVADSASSDGSAAAVRQQFPNVRVIDAPNRGYGAGVNRGIAATSGEFVLALNPDTNVPAGTVQKLVAQLVMHPDVAVAGPALRYPSGALQPSRRRFPTRLTPLFESTIVQEWWPQNRWTRLYYVEDRPADIPQDVDWLVGACMLVRRAAIERVGGFDESFRMYSEEVEWCWRFHRHGWKVMYVPDAEIVHHEGASTRQDVPARQVEFDASRVALMRRLYGSQWGVIAEGIVRANYLAHLTREFAKWLLGHRRALRRQRMAFYGRAALTGPRNARRDAQ